MTTGAANPGLEGVVAAETRLSSVDGLAGELIIGGFLAEEIAPRAIFEETVYLLWRGALPNARELKEFQAKMSNVRALPEAAFLLLRSAAKLSLPVMDALRMAAGAISLHPAAAGGMEEQALVLVATFPTIVAAYSRLLKGLEPIAPRTDLRHAANYLYMLTGEEPTEAKARALETYLNVVVDHGLNASTFTARVITSTGSDIVSAITGAIGALKGPLHGGAPGPALEMVFEIGRSERAESYLREKLGAGERLMGFGHRIYKVRDPRADVLAKAADHFYSAGGNRELYTLAKHVEETAIRLLEEYKPGRNLQTNVEFYTALLLHGVDFDTGLFAPTFAVSRVGGWTAHCFEQKQTGRLIRPQSVYIGPRRGAWIPVEAR